MSATTTAMKRVFRYGTATFPDPDETMSPQEVKEYYSITHTELMNFEIVGPTPNGDNLEYEFKKAAGTKG